MKLAVIGAGVIGKRHLLALTDCPGIELVGIVDPNVAAKQVAAEYGVAFYQTVDALVKDKQPDGAVVATPTEHHFSAANELLDLGVHVLVEKPFMATMEEAEKIVTQSENVGRHVLVGHQRRYYQLVQNARELVQGGTLGQLVTVSGQWNMRKPPSYYAPDWRKKWQAGPILTNLIHEIDLLRYICGDIVSISAETSNSVLGFEKEDAAAIIMRFESGALGTFLLSDQATSPWSWELATGENAAFPKTGQNATRFMGTKAALDFPNLTLWHHGDGSADWNHGMKSEDRSVEISDPYVTQLNHFADVVAGIAPPIVSARDASASLQATLAVYDAANSGKRIVL